MALARVFLVLGLLSAICIAVFTAPARRRSGDPVAPSTILYTAGLQGETEPCG